MAVERRQIDAARAVVRWYLDRYHRTAHDLGGPATFVDRARVGSFAVTPVAFERGAPDALFRVFIAMTLFQRRQDQQVFRILRGMRAAEVRQVANARALESERSRARCRMLRSSSALHEQCDLTKIPGKPVGTCGIAPRTPCALKQHTVLLKRYGHFGKVPTSAALMLSELGVRDLRALRSRALADAEDPLARARFLESALMRVWRVNRKISAMYLSALCNPDLGPPRAPWQEEIDWTWFVVIDSNTDLYLSSLGYSGSGTYDARLEFIRALSSRIDLASLSPGLHSFNPRIVQQAMYTFMSRTNRRAAAVDCSHLPGACVRCPAVLAARCPLRGHGPTGSRSALGGHERMQRTRRHTASARK